MSNNRSADGDGTQGAMQRRQPTAIEHLFVEGSAHTYAVLDGARVDRLLDSLESMKPPSACLFAGELDPGRARIAPYLVELERDGEFVRWLFERGVGRSWGIFLRSDADLLAMRKHLRRFLMVKGPDGNQLYFRYYDPRVLRIYLPTCNAEEVAQVFGPIHAIAAESEDASQMLFYWPDEVPPRIQAVRMPASPAARG